MTQNINKDQLHNDYIQIIGSLIQELEVSHTTTITPQISTKQMTATEAIMVRDMPEWVRRYQLDPIFNALVNRTVAQLMISLDTHTGE